MSDSAVVRPSFWAASDGLNEAFVRGVFLYICLGSTVSRESTAIATAAFGWLTARVYSALTALTVVYLVYLHHVQYIYILCVNKERN